MNFKNSVKTLSSQFNLACRIYKPTGNNLQLKQNVLNFESLSKVENDMQKTVAWNNDLMKFYFCKNRLESLSHAFPVNELPVLKKIIEPERNNKVKIEIPLLNIVKKELDLPCSLDKDLVEPSKNISKKALNILRIRRKKMRKHKYKKFMKKMRFVFAKKKHEKEIKKEYLFQSQLKKMLEEGNTFSAQDYVAETLKKVHWKRPITTARGRLAPQWVIKEELEKEAFEKDIEKRIKEISEAIK